MQSDSQKNRTEVSAPHVERKVIPAAPGLEVLVPTTDRNYDREPVIAWITTLVGEADVLVEPVAPSARSGAVRYADGRIWWLDRFYPDIAAWLDAVTETDDVDSEMEGAAPQATA